jgi:hypothetical protein
MNKKTYFAILDTETNTLVNAEQAEKAGADVVKTHYPELFSDDDGELAFIIHEANKVGEWKVVPVSVDIQITITQK